MKIAIGNDHVAVDLKKEIFQHLQSLGHEVINLGTDSYERCDYPVYGEKVGRYVAQGKADLGIALCGTGVGISLAANRVAGIRAVVCSEPYSARLSREHNNTNILAMGARVLTPEQARNITLRFLETPFAGGRHERRVQKLMDLENQGLQQPK